MTKKFVFLLLLTVLALPLAAAETTTTPEPQCQSADLSFAEVQSVADDLFALDTPEPVEVLAKCIYPKPTSIDCSRWNNNYCGGYYWDCNVGCCKPTYVSPGAYCPNICP
jgi:hypothetical protein